jgi:hypothetical protein
VHLADLDNIFRGKVCLRHNDCKTSNGSFLDKDFHKADESALMAFSFVFTNPLSKFVLIKKLTKLGNLYYTH